MYNTGMKDLGKESSEKISSSDLKQILSDHKKWLDSNGQDYKISEKLHVYACATSDLEAV